MSYLDAVLVARARSTGKAQRSATVRHLRLVPKPMAMVLWQLGAEPFTAAAFAWGCGLKDRHMVVAGEPRDRELAFRALTEVARAAPVALTTMATSRSRGRDDCSAASIGEVGRTVRWEG